MKLSKEDRSILNGSLGRGAIKAMEILTGLGRIHEAADLVPIRSVQVSGVSYKNIGEHGLAFLEEWAAMGSRAVVPAYMNPGGADRKIWRSMGFPASFVRKQLRVVAALEKLGVRPSLTCTPYHAGETPAYRDHIAWAESSAVSFANSVLGARSNREGGPSALAAALTGRTPRHTFHLDGARRPTRIVHVRCSVSSSADAGALGWLIGRAVASDERGGVPYIMGVEPPRGPSRTTWLKALGAAMAASGSVALYHIDGVTPEAAASGGKPAVRVRKRTVITSLKPGYKALNRGRAKLDVVTLGCPHASAEDLVRIAGILEGRKAKVPVWISVSRSVRDRADEDGMTAKLKRSGAVLVADTCMVVAPLKELGIKSIATDSAKAAVYLPSHHGAAVHFGPTDRVLAAAVRGVWR